MKHIDNDTRFTGTCGSLLGGGILFENQDEFDAHIEEKRVQPGRKYKLWDEIPLSFPCIMFDIGQMYNPDGADWTLNAFIYDAVIHEDDEDGSEG